MTAPKGEWVVRTQLDCDSDEGSIGEWKKRYPSPSFEECKEWAEKNLNVQYKIKYKIEDEFVFTPGGMK